MPQFTSLAPDVINLCVYQWVASEVEIPAIVDICDKNHVRYLSYIIDLFAI